MLDEVITLPDKRELGFIRYGNLEGYPIFLFHGTPGSRIWGLEMDDTVKNSGYQFIATDRPGFGNSSPKKDRTLLDFCEDIIFLTDSLGIKNFSVLGASGGGAYACAISKKYSDRVSSCHLISSATPFVNGKSPKEMGAQNKYGFFMAKYLPFLLKKSYVSQKKMLSNNREKFYTSLEKNRKFLNEWDRQYLATEEQFEGFATHLEEALKNGVDECINEPVLLTKDWGFNIQEMTVPTFIWHGGDDKMAPVKMMENFSRQIPYSKLHIVPKAGHFLMDNEQIWKEIIAEVITSN